MLLAKYQTSAHLHAFLLQSFSENLKVLSAWLAFTLRGEVPKQLLFWVLVYAPFFSFRVLTSEVSAVCRSRGSAHQLRRAGIVMESFSLIVLLSLISFHGWKH